MSVNDDKIVMPLPVLLHYADDCITEDLVDINLALEPLGARLVEMDTNEYLNSLL